jgi:hypothetical protein
MSVRLEKFEKAVAGMRDSPDSAEAQRDGCKALVELTQGLSLGVSVRWLNRFVILYSRGEGHKR